MSLWRDALEILGNKSDEFKLMVLGLMLMPAGYTEKSIAKFFGADTSFGDLIFGLGIICFFLGLAILLGKNSERSRRR
jgi:hypothetical protein